MPPSPIARRSSAGAASASRLVLEPTLDNPHDINAIKGLKTTGKQIGYLTRELASTVVSHGPGAFSAFVAGIGPGGGGLYGVAPDARGIRVNSAA
jgi:hypothetical protein